MQRDKSDFSYMSFCKLPTDKNMEGKKLLGEGGICPGATKYKR
jgi:hypothetical protein